MGVSTILVQLIGLLVWQTLAVAAHAHCGTDHLPPVDMARDQARMRRVEGAINGRRTQRLTCQEICDGCIQIETRFHLMTVLVDGEELLPHPTESMEQLDGGQATVPGDFTTLEAYTQIIRDNIAVTNTHLAGSPFRLNFIEEDTTLVQDDDFLREAFDNRIQMTSDLGENDLSKLDVYLSYTLLEAQAGVILGFAVLPSQQLTSRGDGVFLRYDT
jgi:hypothetical protein